MDLIRRRAPLLIAALGLTLLTVTSVIAVPHFDPHGEGDRYPRIANGRHTERPSVRAYRLDGQGIRLDGKLDDPVWERAEAATGFRMWSPDRGAEAAQQTVFKVAYDSDAIYFGISCHEDNAEDVHSALSRRDDYNKSDIVAFYLDPYHDLSTGYSFKVNPHGVQMDVYVYDDGNMDTDWDAVWTAETDRNADGWTAELRIPFSSIRYRPGEEMTWGLQVYRFMHRLGQDTSWVIWDRDTRGFVSRFGTLTGLSNVSAPRQLELLPYAVQRTLDPVVQPSAERGGILEDGADPVDPVDDALDGFQNVGLDLKYGVTANLTLNATVQPDFGQVEADPSELNLSPFETWFEEKRPFFIEGNRFFEHRGFNLFYSRRIGTGSENSRIRYAAKLTGKTAGNISLAALAASTDLTGSGQAHNLFKSGRDLTNYFVTRVGKDFKDGNHSVNAMQTAVLRSGDSHDAYTSGVDFDLNFHDRDYNVSGSLVGSTLDFSGDESSYTGTGGSLSLGRFGGTIRGEVYGRWEGNQLYLNDLGYLQAPDEISSGGWIGWRYDPENEETFLSNGNLNVNVYRSWLYSGRSAVDSTGAPLWSYSAGHPQGGGGNINGWFQTRGFWETWFGASYNQEGSSRWVTRGGPLMTTPWSYDWWVGGNTDWRKPIVFNLGIDGYQDDAGSSNLSMEAHVNWTVNSAVSTGFKIEYDDGHDDSQWIWQGPFENSGGGIDGLSYVFGELDTDQLEFVIRTNLLFSRTMSLELYAQPFIVTGDFKNASELMTPDSYDLRSYAADDFDTDDYDFTQASMNLNMVYRWEYRPGSTFYVVWKHNRWTGRERMDVPGDPLAFETNIDTSMLFQNEPENILLIKMSYWFSL